MRPTLPSLLLLAILAPIGLAQDASLRAGAAAVEITPDIESSPVTLAGFGHGRAPTTVHDPIWARALVLESGGERCALVALDLIGYLSHRIRAAAERIEREIGLPADRVIVSSSHTHHGPDTIGIWGPRPTRSGVDPAYLDRVDAAIVEAVRLAFEAREPARLRFGEVAVPEILRDTRDPVVSDPVLRTLHLARPDGETVATAFVYAMHPEVLWRNNPALTSDFPHFLRVRAEADLGGTALFFPGSVGGMQTPKVERNDFDECRRVGELLATRGIESLEGADWHAAPPLSIRTRNISLPITNPIFRVATALGIIPGQRHLEYEKEGIARLFETPKLPSRLHVLALGPLRIATVPGELFPELAAPIRDAMVSGPRIIVGLAGNEIGYIIPADQWDPDDYEESMSLGPETGPRLVEAIRGLLDDLESPD